MLVFDVSEYNSEYTIPFIDCAGIVARVTKRGNKMDEKFYDFYNRSIAEDKKFGAYKYTYAHNINDAHIEAETVCQVLRGCNKMELGFWLDLENDFHRSCNDELIESIIKEYKMVCGLYGITFAGIYCDLDFYKKHRSVLERYPIWIARWTHNSEFGMPISSNFVAWQYTDKYDGTSLDASLWNINKKEEKPDKSELIAYNPDNVKLLQNYLNRYYGYTLKVDGVMGKNTFTAICQTIAK